MPSRKLFDITVAFVFETAKAVKYTDGKTEFWVPKSMMGDDGSIQVEESNGGRTFTLTAPEWWLRDKDLI